MARRLSKCIAVLVLVLSWSAAVSGQTLSGTTLTVSGAEQSSGGVWDSGSVTVTVNGYVKTLTGVKGYGQYSDAGSVASLIAVHLSEDTSAPVWAKSVGSVITMVGRAGQPVTVSATTAYDTAHFGGPSFTFTSGSTTVTPTPFLSLHCTRSTMGTSDTANCVAAIEGTSTLYGAHAATNSMAFTVNTASWTSAPVGTDGTATATGFSEASAGTYTVRADYPGDSYYSAMHATATITVGFTPSSTGVYSYSITGPSGSGYDPAGNITAYADSVNGQWTLGYDSLNRVQAASSSPAIKPYTPYLCWSYDSFGNRSQQYFGSSAFSGGGTTACSGGGSMVATQDQYYSSNNRLTRDTTISTTFGYDASGNMTSDGSGGHQYAYDAEGRVCAMSTGISPVYYWGYLYDAEGHRVAKGSISSLDCSLVNGDSFAVTEYYIIGPDSAPMTVLDGSGNWKHTDVPAGPGAMAVYDGDGLHFRLSDWLGTHRVQTDYKGDTPVENTYQSLPFGELLGSSAGATQKHFTGKEHDDESGLDYFGARYYGSGVGRWMSADWALVPTVIPFANLDNPQSLNLYSYIGNNPLGKRDSDGHHQECDPDKSSVDKNGNLTVMAGKCREVDDGPWWLAFNPWGKLGGPAHRQTVQKISEMLKREGYEVQTEVRVETPRGAKIARYVDVVGVKKNTGETQMYQVGAQNKDGTPVARERSALDDIEKATGIRPKFEDKGLGARISEIESAMESPARMAGGEGLSDAASEEPELPLDIP